MQPPLESSESEEHDEDAAPLPDAPTLNESRG
jgi:hypothetical protein